jgi:hypothetical protein
LGLLRTHGRAATRVSSSACSSGNCRQHLTFEKSQRECSEPTGTPRYWPLIFGIGGSATASFSFRPVATAERARFNGQLEANPLHLDVRPDVDVFGFNSNSVGAQMLTSNARVVTPAMFISCGGDPSIPIIMNAWNGDLWPRPRKRPK